MKFKKRSKEKVDQMVSAAKASLAIEGLELTKQEEGLVKARLQGEISQQECRRLLIKLIFGCDFKWTVISYIY